MIMKCEMGTFLVRMFTNNLRNHTFEIVTSRKIEFISSSLYHLFDKHNNIKRWGSAKKKPDFDSALF